MSHSIRILRRAVGSAGIALALSAAAILPATAQTGAPQAAPVADAMTVTRDPATGQLRAATAAEQANLRALQARSRLRAAAPRVQQKVHASGARGARLTDESLSSSVAVRGADGRIEVAHSAEEAAAQAAARAQTQAHVAPTPATE